MWHQLIFRYPSGGGPSRPSTAYAIEYTAFTSMQRCIQQKTSKPFPDSQKSLRDCDRTPCKKYPKSNETVQSHRRIAYFEEIYKRQGAKRGQKGGMSLFVVMRGVMGDSGNGAKFQVTETGRSFETDPTKVAGGAGRACGASRGLRPACRRIRPRCRRGRYCERRQ